MSLSDWNPRYLAFCAAHGHANDPEGMGAAYVGDHHYVIWIGERWKEWDALRDHDKNHARDLNEHRAFDAWLWESPTAKAIARKAEAYDLVRDSMHDELFVGAPRSHVDALRSVVNETEEALRALEPTP